MKKEWTWEEAMAYARNKWGVKAVLTCVNPPDASEVTGFNGRLGKTYKVGILNGKESNGDDIVRWLGTGNSWTAALEDAESIR